MAFFILYICSVILAITLVQAAPWPVHVTHATHRTRTFKRGLELRSYYPRPTFKSIKKTGISARDTPSSSDGATNLPCNVNNTAISFVASELGIDKSSIRYRSGRFGAHGGFAYLEQIINDKPVVNTAANVGFADDCRVIAFGSSLVDPKDVTVAPSESTADCEKDLPKIEESLGGSHTRAPAETVYYLKEDRSLELVCPVQIRNKTTGFWVEAYVSPRTGELISTTDYVAHASYNVVPIQDQNLFSGRKVLVDPADPVASPNGWHGSNDNATSGNHVVAFVLDRRQRNTELVVDPSSEGLEFNFEYDEDQPRGGSSMAAAVTNAFYVMNVMHDVAHRYGFTAEAGNFEVNEDPDISDPVLVSVQDASGRNNADFSTPADGSPPVCHLFLFDTADPERDSALSNDIMIHEYTHGITNRLTGGRHNAGCLQSLEASGMGEGWSDMMAIWVAQKSADVADFTIGPYVFGREGGRGLRSFPYSTSATRNPQMYSDLRQLNEPHNIGEVWANMLFNLYADLVRERGFSAKAMTDPDGSEGNIVFMHIMMDALSLQPCNPTMVTARDAMLQADQNRYNGANGCIISRAFAKRGLGAGADESYQNDRTVLDGCDPVE